MPRTVCCLIALAAAASAADRRTAVLEEAARPPWARAVAKLTWITRRGRPGVGTAVLVGPRLALTAHHCVKDWSGRALLRFGYDGVRGTQLARRLAIKIVSGSPAADFAILLLDRPVTNIEPLKMATKKIRRCDTKKMLLAGYSADPGKGRRGRVLTYDDGCRLKKIRTDAGRLLTDALCYEGASGGPAFVKDKDTPTYHWFGIVQGNINVRDPRHVVTYAVYQVVYERALKDALAKYP